MNIGTLEGESSGVTVVYPVVSTSNDLHTYAAACWIFVCSCRVSSGSIAVIAVERLIQNRQGEREREREESEEAGVVASHIVTVSGVGDDGLGIYHFGGSRGVGFMDSGLE